jgi:hypothetical protein
MDKEEVLVIIGSATTVAVAIGGWIFSWAMQRDAKTRDRLQKRVAKFEQEVLARIEVEKSASEWIAELSNLTPRAAMLEARKRAEEKSGLRPRLSPNEVLSKD